MNEDKLSYEEKIYKVMLLWYNNDNEKVEQWLDKPWRFTECQHMNGTFYTPREIIELGQAKKIYKLILICVGC